MTYSELANIIHESARLDHEGGIIRSYETRLEKASITPKPIKVITGIRRSGKSYLLKKLYRKLIDTDGISVSNILFLNFEDDRLIQQQNLTSLRNIYELFLTAVNSTQPVYIFLDEIQYVSGWERFVRTIYDSTLHHIYITGSNSHLLSSEFSTSLGGRILEFHIFPFSFAEFLQSFQIKIPQNPFEWAELRSSITFRFEQYVKFGGLPEIINLPESEKLNARNSLIEKIIVRDVINRFKLRYPTILKSLYLYLELHTGDIASSKNIANYIKNQGEIKNLSDKTVKIYLEYLEKTFLVMAIKKFSYKTKEIFSEQKKYYFVDNIFSVLADPEDWLENVVFNHLIRVNDPSNVYYGRDERGREVDFVIRNSDQRLDAIQVCYKLTDDNLDREIRTLKLFSEYNKDRLGKLELVYQFDERSRKSEIADITLIEASHKLLPQN